MSTGNSLKGSRTLENLKAGFQGESMANRRYLYYAQMAEKAGQKEVAEVFRKTAEAETGHAFGHMNFLGIDPVIGMEVRDVEDALRAAIQGETYEWTQMYPGFAKVAREEGFDKIAEWLEALVKVERFHARRFDQALEKLQASKGEKVQVEDEVLYH
ncbi:MAG TPA: rubrerythrin [Nitrososphaeria archaeon]|jgi:rubrerythrin|nr:rubrerythrin family protein [Conexivisphaerales archaeon]HEU16158.1 rubrerythrin [Nitrososphaeria archaeon]